MRVSWFGVWGCMGVRRGHRIVVLFMAYGCWGLRITWRFMGSCKWRYKSLVWVRPYLKPYL